MIGMTQLTNVCADLGADRLKKILHHYPIGDAPDFAKYTIPVSKARLSLEPALYDYNQEKLLDTLRCARKALASSRHPKARLAAFQMDIGLIAHVFPSLPAKESYRGSDFRTFHAQLLLGVAPALQPTNVFMDYAAARRELLSAFNTNLVTGPAESLCGGMTKARREQHIYCEMITSH